MRKCRRGIRPGPPAAHVPPWTLGTMGKLCCFCYSPERKCHGRTCARVPSNRSWVVGYPRTRDPGAGGEKCAPRAPGLSAWKCRWGQSARAGCLVGGPQRKDSGAGCERTLQKVGWGAIWNARRGGESNPSQTFADREPSKGEAGRSTSHCRRPACPAAVRRGRAQRGLDAGGPRVVPTRGAKAPPLRVLIGCLRKQQDRARRKGYPPRSGKEKGNVTSQPRLSRSGGRGTCPWSARARAGWSQGGSGRSERRDFHGPEASG